MLYIFLNNTLRKLVVCKFNMTCSSKASSLKVFVFKMEITSSVRSVSLLVCFLILKAIQWEYSVFYSIYFPYLILIALKWVYELNCGIGAVNTECYCVRNLNLSSVSLLIYLIKMLSSKLSWRDNAEWNICYHPPNT